MLEKCWSSEECPSGHRMTTGFSPFDALQFRAIGQATLENFVKGKILKQFLMTRALYAITVTKTQKQWIKQIKRDRRLQGCFLKCQISYIAKQGADPTLPNSLYGPIYPLPKELVDKHGLYPTRHPRVATWKKCTKMYQYIVMANFPFQWIPDVVILKVYFLVEYDLLAT